LLTEKKGLLLTTALAVVLTLGLALAPFSAAEAAEDYELTILGTTDMHQYLMPYDYMDDTPDEGIGFSKVYTLIEEQRQQKENTMLLSAGDIIQGSLIGDYEYRVDPLGEGETQTIVEAFNAAEYDAVAVGNHELQDYGIEFFEHALEGAEFDWLSANLKRYEDDELYVEPYEIYERDLGDRTVEVGVISFLPPQTYDWGRDYMEGELYIEQIVDQAEEYIPELEEKSDIVVIAAHTGLAAGYRDETENAGMQLAQIDGVDAMVLGHDHEKFPGGYEDLDNVDSEAGTVHGVPTVMAGAWGSSLGVIDLDLSYEDEWEVADFAVELLEVDEEVESHPKIEEIAADVHEATKDYVRTPVAETDQPITSYFARVKDATITQIINEAQLEYGRRFIDANPEYEDHKILAAAAPFRFGREGPEDYTDVADEIRISDVNDIYMFPNEVRIVEFDGEMVLDWLEYSAQNFNQIDPDLDERQNLINWDFAGFYWDVLEGVEYDIDITQPEGERIVNATYQGEPLSADQDFLIVTNDHRATGGGDFPHLDGDTIVYETPTTHHEHIAEWLEENDPETDAAPTQNWRIKPFEYEGELVVQSHPEAAEYIEERELDFFEYLETDEDGWGIYRFTF